MKTGAPFPYCSISRTVASFFFRKHVGVLLALYPNNGEEEKEERSKGRQTKIGLV